MHTAYIGFQRKRVEQTELLKLNYYVRSVSFTAGKKKKKSPVSPAG